MRLSMLLALALTLLAGCGGETSSDPTPEPGAEATPEATPEPTPEVAAEGAAAVDDDDSAAVVAAPPTEEPAAAEAATEPAESADAVAATNDAPSEPADTKPPAVPTKPAGTDPPYSVSVIAVSRIGDTDARVDLLVRADAELLPKIVWTSETGGAKVTGPKTTPGKNEATLSWTLSGVPEKASTGKFVGKAEGFTQDAHYQVPPLEAEPADAAAAPK